MNAQERAHVAKLEQQVQELRDKCDKHLAVYREQALELIELRSRLAAIKEMTQGIVL